MKKIKNIIGVCLFVAFGMVSCSSDDNSVKPEEENKFSDFEYIIEYSNATGEELALWEESIAFQFNGEKAKVEDEPLYESITKEQNFYVYRKVGAPAVKQVIKIKQAETTSVTINLTPIEAMEIGEPIELKISLLKNGKFIRDMKANISYTTVVSLTFAERY